MKAILPSTIIFSEDVCRVCNTTLFSAPGLHAETAVIGFDLEGIAVSSGSACSSGKVQPSHVLEAMRAGPELAQGGVRISLGWETTENDIDRALEAWRKLAGTLVKRTMKQCLNDSKRRGFIGNKLKTHWSDTRNPGDHATFSLPVLM